MERSLRYSDLKCALQTEVEQASIVYDPDHCQIIARFSSGTASGRGAFVFDPDFVDSNEVAGRALLNSCRQRRFRLVLLRLSVVQVVYTFLYLHI
jgi:hypothetical protein